jgi:hypothetical protein
VTVKNCKRHLLEGVFGVDGLTDVVGEGEEAWGHLAGVVLAEQKATGGERKTTAVRLLEPQLGFGGRWPAAPQVGKGKGDGGPSEALNSA